MTQNERILKYMTDFGSISTMEAFIELGVTRLPSRIHEIIASGIKVDNRMETAKNRYGENVHFMRYSLG